MVVGMTAVILAGGGLIVAGAVRAAEDTPPVSVEIEPCVGPQAMSEGAECEERFGPARENVMGPRNIYFYVPAE